MERLRKFRNPALFKLLAFLLLAEIITVIIGFIFLRFGVSVWVRQKVEWLKETAQTVAGTSSWPGIDKIQIGDLNSPIFQKDAAVLRNLNQQYFPRNEGEIHLVKVEGQDEFILVKGGVLPFTSNGRANDEEKEAATQGRVTVTPAPYTNKFGTQISAYAPVMGKDGKLAALIAVDLDASTIRDLQNIVQTSYLISIFPALLLGAILSLFLAANFVEPLPFLREVRKISDEAKEMRGTQELPPLPGPATPAHTQNAALPALPSPQIQVNTGTPDDSHWKSLTKREQEIARLLGEGYENKEIAEKLFIASETVKRHAKNIYQKLEIKKRLRLTLYLFAIGILKLESINEVDATEDEPAETGKIPPTGYSTGSPPSL